MEKKGCGDKYKSGLGHNFSSWEKNRKRTREKKIWKEGEHSRNNKVYFADYNNLLSPFYKAIILELT